MALTNHASRRLVRECHNLLVGEKSLILECLIFGAAQPLPAHCFASQYATLCDGDMAMDGFHSMSLNCKNIAKGKLVLHIKYRRGVSGVEVTYYGMLKLGSAQCGKRFG